ncbi:hypothetical protein RHSIM_Rhsim01G0014900 [Rhododendron simsii]|uniref:F-box domain-containing protein n=1 Tax=Rhododendron simsii TaxID=118357 RepID=A0A834HJC5_RHOSS|nr:hypothetical protein RHSIM_Rhsim01G0014900 [Rhododendron simsii]
MTRKASNKRRKAVLNVTPSDISPAAELLATNLDLLTEILLRLPVLSTIRFKCVSKHWLSLLSDSQFAANHSTQNPRPSSISDLYFNIPQTLNFVSLHRHNLPSLSFLNGVREGFRTIMVAHSCNGLLLCYIRRMMSIDRHVVQYNIAFIVCNPTTKKYTLLPIRDGVVIGWSAYLVFDPSKSPRHYKVVLVGSDHHRCEIDVYSSQSLYDFLKRFDVDVEEIIAMPNPQSPKILTQCKILYFGECGGCLILIQSRPYCPSGLRILELERDYSGWVVKCRINFRPLISAFPEMKSRRNNCLHGFKVLYCAVKGESERGLVLLLAIPGRIVSYNPKKKTWDVLRDLVPHESEALDLNIYYAVPFIETVFQFEQNPKCSSTYGLIFVLIINDVGS